MDLSALADFHRVAAAGSLGKASRDTGRPKATLSRHIRQLEESLGVRLVERGQRALRLTAEGQVLYARTRDRLREIEDAGQAIASGNDQPRGVLRVSVPLSFERTHGGRLAAEFIARYPAVHLYLEASNRYVDLIEEGFDVVVRVNPVPTSELVGRLIARDEQWIVAPPSLPLPKAGKRGAPVSVPAVAMTLRVQAAVWECERNGKSHQLKPDFRMQLSTLNGVRVAAVAGAGAALLPRSLVRNDVAEGKLVRWGIPPRQTAELWVLHSSRRLVSPKVSAFVAFVVESFPTGQL